MTNPFIDDLIDHKERVSKYMQIATDILYGHFMRVHMHPPENVTLLDIIGYVIGYQQYGVAPFDALQPQGQLASLIANTMAFFSAEKIGDRAWLQYAILDLFHRAAVHDHSKFGPEEFDLYNQAFPELQKHPYGSDEFKAAVAKLGPAWKHHCEVNSHHPEHYPNGISDMHAIDLIEMTCDWLAASERSQKDIMEGLEINRARFGIDDHLFPILKNTIVALKEQGNT